MRGFVVAASGDRPVRVIRIVDFDVCLVSPYSPPLKVLAPA